MAKITALVSSYYEWVIKTEHHLRSDRKENAGILRNMPSTHPTALSEVAQHSTKVLGALRETEFKERAEYWHKLFAGIIKDGWQGD